MANEHDRHSRTEPPAQDHGDRAAAGRRRHWSAAFGYALTRDIAAAPNGPAECGFPDTTWRFWEPSAPRPSRRRPPPCSSAHEWS
jgi:hypothetical protein